MFIEHTLFGDLLLHLLIHANKLKDKEDNKATSIYLAFRLSFILYRLIEILLNTLSIAHVVTLEIPTRIEISNPIILNSFSVSPHLFTLVVDVIVNRQISVAIIPTMSTIVAIVLSVFSWL